VKRVSERFDAFLEILWEVKLGQCDTCFGFVERGLDRRGGIEVEGRSAVGTRCYVCVYFGTGDRGVGDRSWDICAFTVIEDVGAVEVGNTEVFGDAGKEFGGFVFDVVRERIVVEEVYDWVGAGGTAVLYEVLCDARGIEGEDWII